MFYNLLSKLVYGGGMGGQEEAPKVSREVLFFPVNPEFGESCIDEAFLSLCSASLTPSCHWFSGHLSLDRLINPWDS